LLRSSMNFASSSLTPIVIQSSSDLRAAIVWSLLSGLAPLHGVL
jgi:hypothetical protein